MHSDRSSLSLLADAALVPLARCGDAAARVELRSRHHAATQRLADTVHAGRPAEEVAERAFEAAVEAACDESLPALRPLVLAEVLAQSVAPATAPSGAPVSAAPAYPGGAGDQAVNPQVHLGIRPPRHRQLPDDTEAAFCPALTNVVLDLPEQAKAALWHVEVEGEPAEVAARVLGLEPSAVAAVVDEARDTVQRGVLEARRATVSSTGCLTTHNLLLRAVSEPLGHRARLQLRAHVATCSRCSWTSRYVEMARSDLRRVLATALLGPAGASYLLGDAAPLRTATGSPTTGSPATGSPVAGQRLLPSGASGRGLAPGLA